MDFSSWYNTDLGGGIKRRDIIEEEIEDLLRNPPKDPYAGVVQMRVLLEEIFEAGQKNS